MTSLDQRDMTRFKVCRRSVTWRVAELSVSVNSWPAAGSHPRRSMVRVPIIHRRPVAHLLYRYIDYQVVTYNITSTHGTRDQFQSMIETCHAAGVKVIVDTLWNHMVALDGGLGYAGSNFSHFNYPGIYNYSNFHHCSEPNGQIDTYNSTLITWTCMLSNLAE